MAQQPKTPAGLARHLGRVAREARQKAGLTQAEAAERIGLATEVYGRLERGNMLPSLPTLLRLCRALAVDANPLLGFSASQPPEWLTLEAPAEDEPPAMRRLLRTVRQLKPRQLTALSSAASAMLPASAAPASHDVRQPAQ
ncbi:helix-turn-helix domain-containing protein [Archangium violaceum]|uniref:helix-turn-helix domain-containing protein n=1 Tax=Archangium violaceum TaxID=83451 RepID=UPI00193B279A|nr:helix-turn-helix domain-containing protein [Archangium violaceum]QRK05261.1 helix-turn-helix domain-containing protein [Archangium violaceum]